jgi:N-acyl-L-homoserine lactone synthetase
MILAKFMLFIKANPRVKRVPASGDIFSEISRLRYKVYCEEKGFLKKDNYPQLEEKDEYDEHATHIVVIVKGKIAGYCRVILPNEKGLPIFRHFNINDGVNRQRSCEVSRFIISKAYRKDKLVRREIFRLLSNEVVKVAVEEKIEKVFAVLENWLLKSLNNRGYEFQKIGKGEHYMGAITYPTKMDIMEYGSE